MEIIAWPFLLASYILGTIAGVVTMFLAWVIGVVMSLNAQIVASPVVSAGWPITLALANVLFVLAIVVIAIATIVRSENYGIKKALVRLVLIAVLVNFGLVFSNAILGFADNLTGFWLTNMLPPKDVAFDNAANQGFRLASSITGALQPQGSWLSNQIGASGSATSTISAVASAVWNFANPFSALRIIMSSVFSVIIMWSIVIFLAVFIAMLLRRYITLAILLVLLPLAWAAWIFPASKKYFNEWWGRFLNQAFFAPIVVFFMWLAISAAQNMKGVLMGDLYQSGDATPIWGALKSWFGYELAGVALVAMQALVVMSILGGGMVAANKMGIELASTATKAVAGASKAVGGYVVRRTGGAIARRATAERPPEPKYNTNTRVGRLMNTLNSASYKAAAPLRAVATSTPAREIGITQEAARYGARTESGGNIRSVAKGKLARADELEALGGEENKKAARKLRREGLRGMATAQKQAKENPGLLRSMLIGAGLREKGSRRWGEVSREDLTSVGYRTDLSLDEQKKKLAALGVAGTPTEQLKTFEKEVSIEKSKEMEGRKVQAAERKKEVAESKQELAERKAEIDKMEDKLRVLRAESFTVTGKALEANQKAILDQEKAFADARTKLFEKQAEVAKGATGDIAIATRDIEDVQREIAKNAEEREKKTSEDMIS